MAREPFAAKLTSIWIGAFIFWSFRGFRGNYRDLLSKEYETRNMIIGYLINMIALILIVIYFIRMQLN